MVEEGPKEPIVKQLKKPVIVPALEVHNPVAEQPVIEEFISHPLEDNQILSDRLP
jgi:hypothetical protein